MNRMLFFSVCLFSVLFVSCSSETGNKGAASACLVERYRVYTGNYRANYELTISNKTVSEGVNYYYNPPTGGNASSGSLASIFEAVTGTPPETPADYRTIDSILPVFKDNGWVVIDDAKRDGSARMSTIRTVNFRKDKPDSK